MYIRPACVLVDYMHTVGLYTVLVYYNSGTPFNVTVNRLLMNIVDFLIMIL